jgi:hypothetical protein
MGRGRRRSLLAAGVSVAAAVGGLAGNKITNRLDWAVIMFVVVTVAGSLAALWLERSVERASTASSGSTSRDHTAGAAHGVEAEGRSIHLGPTVEHAVAGRDVNVAHVMHFDRRRANRDDA